MKVKVLKCGANNLRHEGLVGELLPKTFTNTAGSYFKVELYEEGICGASQIESVSQETKDISNVTGYSGHAVALRMKDLAYSTKLQQITNILEESQERIKKIIEEV